MSGAVDHAIVHAFINDIHTAAEKACVGHYGVLQLSRLHPLDDDFVVAGRFKIGHVEEMTKVAIAAAEGGHNVYIEARLVAPTVRGTNRGKIEDTAAVFALVVDRDADKGIGGVELAEPTWRVETSPGNFHDWFVLDCAIGGKEAQTLGATLRRAVGADSDTGNPTQPYRVAGTPNYPNTKKRARGRETCSTSFHNGGPVWRLDALRKMLPPPPTLERATSAVFAEHATGMRDAFVEQLLAKPATELKDRSGQFNYACCEAIERGMTAADFEALSREYPDCCSEKYLKPRDRLRTEIERIWAPHAAEIAEKDSLGARIAAQILEAHDRQCAAAADRSIASAKHSSSQTSEPPKPRIVPIAEWVNSFGAAADPLIEDVAGGEIIGKAQQGVIYGPAGTGKTAVVNEMALAVATGAGLGRALLMADPIYRSMKGRVLVAVYEDPLDYRRRILALAIDRRLDLPALNLAIVPTHLNITNDRDRTKFIQLIREDSIENGPPSLLIVDTTAAAVGGQSLSDDDVVGGLFELSQQLVREFLCTTIFVTHPGKDETRGIGGSYRFHGNTDFILKTTKTANGFRLMKEKDRNGAKRALFDYSLQFVEVERTTSGQPRTGAIVGSIIPCAQESLPQHVGPPNKTTEPLISARKLSDRQRLAREALTEAVATAGRAAPVDMKLPGSVRVVALDAWRSEMLARGVIDTDSKNPRGDFRRLKESLLTRCLIGERNGLIWAVER